jgi:hypothetical protein
MSDMQSIEQRLREFAAAPDDGADWEDVLRRSGNRVWGLRFPRRRLAHALAAALVVIASVAGALVARATESGPTGGIGSTHCDTPPGVACPSRGGTWPPDDVDFSTLHAQHPVAGHMFDGLAIIDRTGLNGAPYRFTSVRYDAEIGGKRLRAKHLIYGEPRRGSVQVVICGWRIPANAAGETLRFWPNPEFGGNWRGAVVVIRGSETVGGPPLTWRVTRP